MSARIPKCKVYPGADGRWRWTLVGGNGEIQCPSQGYATRGGALAGFRAMQRNAARAVVVVFTDCAPSSKS
jgi:uncharacterized protein YegP (UPF0339 family)